MSCSRAVFRRPAAIERIKASGAKLMAFAPALALAKKLMRSNVDALVIEGMEAGGHIGPVSTSVLAQEILPIVAREIPVFVAGGIGRGEAIAAYLEMGAVGSPAWHPLRLRQRKHRPSEFQEGLHPRLGARCDPVASRSTPGYR